MNKFWALALIYACINAAFAKHCHLKTKYRIEPPLQHLYPYKPSEKSLVEELENETFESSNQPASFNYTYIPDSFQKDFLDLADIDIGPRPRPPGEILSKEERAFQNLALVTNTKRECYEAMPMKIDNITDLMGDWYITAQHPAHLADLSPETCEDIVYQQTGPYEFKKDANVYFKKKWMTINGTGKLLAPGVIIIYWKSLNAPERDLVLVYSIIGTDFRNYVVGYYCNKDSAFAQIIVQTSSRRPSERTVRAAHNSIRKHPQLKIDDVINNKCAIDF